MVDLGFNEGAARIGNLARLVAKRLADSKDSVAHQVGMAEIEVGDAESVLKLKKDRLQLAKYFGGLLYATEAKIFANVCETLDARLRVRERGGMQLNRTPISDGGAEAEGGLGAGAWGLWARAQSGAEFGRA